MFSDNSGLTEFQRAALEGREEDFFELLSKTTSFFGGPKNKTLLHLAAEGRSALVISAVLSLFQQFFQTSLVNHLDDDGQNALHKLALSSLSNSNIAQMLIMCSVNFEQRDKSGRTPDQIALANQNLELARVINEARIRKNNPLPNALNNIVMFAHFFDICFSELREIDESLPFQQMAASQKLRIQASTDLFDVASQAVISTLKSLKTEELRSIFSENLLKEISEKLLEINKIDDREMIKYANLIRNLVKLSSIITEITASARSSLTTTPVEEKDEKLPTQEEQKEQEFRIEEKRRARWQSYVNGLSSRTKNDFLSEFNSANRDVSIRNNKGDSLLKCVVEAGVSNEVINEILNHPNLSFSAITDEIKREIEGKKTIPLRSVLGNENVVSRIVEEKNPKEIRSFIEELRRLKNATNSRAEISTFETTLNQKIREKEAEKSDLKSAEIEEKPTTKLSKSALKKLKKEQKDFEHKSKEEADLERKLTRSTLDKVAFEIFEEIASEVIQEQRREFQSLALDLAPEISEDFFKEFIAEIAAESIADFNEEKRQIKDFLREYRQINSLNDLPTSIQNIARKLADDFLQEDEFRFALKGSSVYQTNRTRRIPGDIDLEFQIPGIAKRTDSEVTDFVREKFDLNIDPTAIFRGRDNSVFSLNIKDEIRGIDISIYDPQKMPKNFSAFITNRESRIEFDQAGAAIYQYPDHFGENVFCVNESVRPLILRLVFLQVIGVISPDDLQLAAQNIQIHPAELLRREFKISDQDNEEVAKGKVEEGIKKFADSHNLSGEALLEFKEELSKFSQTQRNEVGTSPRGNLKIRSLTEKSQTNFHSK